MAPSADLERGAGGVEEPDQLVAAERPVGAEDEQRRLRVGRAGSAARSRRRARPSSPARASTARSDAGWRSSRTGTGRRRCARRAASRRRRRRARRGGSRRGRSARRVTSGRAAVGPTPTATGRVDAPAPPAAREELIPFRSLSSRSSRTSRATTSYVVCAAADVGPAGGIHPNGAMPSACRRRFAEVRRLRRKRTTDRAGREIGWTRSAPSTTQ